MSNIIFVTNMYPTKSHSYFGIHVKEQIDKINEISRVKSDLFFINALEKGYLTYLTSIFLIIRKIKKNKYKTIHIHYGLSGLFLLLFKPKCNVFITLHGGDILIEQGKIIQVFLTKIILKKATKVFVLNDLMAKIVSELGVKYELLPCGVDTNIFQNNTYNNERLNNEKIILFPGDPARIVKNYSLFNETMLVLNNKHNYLFTYKIIHNLSRDEVRDLMLSADCLLMTSISEGSPQVIKEALSCGLRVISVPVGDIKQVIENITSCHISTKFDAFELASLVEISLQECSDNIREQFLSKKLYDNETICNKIINNYKSYDV